MCDKIPRSLLRGIFRLIDGMVVMARGDIVHGLVLFPFDRYLVKWFNVKAEFLGRIHVKINNVFYPSYGFFFIRSVAIDVQLGAIGDNLFMIMNEPDWKFHGISFHG